MLGAYADGFGFTPTEFYHLTLPQLAAYGRYLEEKADMIEDGGSGKSRKTSSADRSAGTIDSVDQLVSMFGDPDSQRAWAEDRAKAKT